MSAPRAVAVVGFKDAGKTKTVEALVRELTRRGLRVGTLKHTSRTHPLDTPGKDTWRHREAGSIASAILTADSAAVFLNHPISVVDAIVGLGALDIVVLEGFRSMDAVARIMIPRDAEEVKELANGLEIAVSGPSVEGLPMIEIGVPLIPLSRVDELADLVESKTFPLLPGLNCGECGYESCKDLAHAILAGGAEARRCVNYERNAIRLKVDGRGVEMNHFVRNVIRNVVLSVVKTLKGCEDPRQIELAIDPGGEDLG